MWSRNNVDIDWYYDEWKDNRHGQSMSLNALSDNPYMQAYEQLNSWTETEFSKFQYYSKDN